jgi:hypothetical protein
VLLTYLQDLRKRSPGPLDPRLAAVCSQLKDEFKRHLDQLDLPVNSGAVPPPAPAAAR